MKKILIIQTASIGDVILATPLLENLHRKYPDAAIDMMVKKSNESLFASHPYLRKLYVWDKSDKKLRNLYVILKDVQSERYDLVVNVQRFFLSGFLTAFSRAKKTIGFKKNPMSVFFSHRVKHKIRTGEFHETERNLLLIDRFVDDPEKRPALYPSTQDDALTSQYKTHQYICVAPASLWNTKQYPAQKWVEFLQQLPEDLYVYFLGSQADHALCEEIINGAGHANGMNLAGKLKLLETASLQRDARMNFVNDSAPMHLASAVNGPVTAIFCSTTPAFGFGPLSDDSKVVETEKNLDCRPCGLHGLRECPEKHFDCAFTIKTEHLMKRIQ
ncbi:MAG: glycosyltransferase family 9 protein [Bacteroidales bacterium]|nr:glycosyltransferase family 9 protein [Bacteroidales bacterium]